MFSEFYCFNLGFLSGFKIGFVMKKMVLIWFSQQLELVFQPSKKLATLQRIYNTPQMSGYKVEAVGGASSVEQSSAS